MPKTSSRMIWRQADGDGKTLQQMNPRLRGQIMLSPKPNCEGLAEWYHAYACPNF